MITAPERSAGAPRRGAERPRSVAEGRTPARADSGGVSPRPAPERGGEKSTPPEKPPQGGRRNAPPRVKLQVWRSVRLGLLPCGQG